jgi:hypothetical protein
MEDPFKKMVEDLCSVQPMDSNIMKNLYQAGETKEELEKQGYKPVSRIGLLWIKDESLPDPPAP